MKNHKSEPDKQSNCVFCTRVDFYVPCNTYTQKMECDSSLCEYIEKEKFKEKSIIQLVLIKLCSVLDE